MANTLTGLIPTLYTAVNRISRELTGFIPAVTFFPTAEQAAKDQTISYPVVGSGSAVADISPAATGPDPSDVTVAPGTMSISNSKSDTFYWTGNEQKSLGSAMYQRILEDQFVQSMRKLVNAIETDLAELYVYASRAYGTAGSTPFGTNLAEAAQMLKILKDNGAPDDGDLQLVLNTTAGAALRTLTQLTKANEAGTTELRARGTLLDLLGFMVRESAQVQSHTKGTGGSYVTDGASATGTTSIAIDGGSGTVLAGDVVTFAADTVNKFIVGTGVAAAGTIVLNNPGVRGTTIPDGNALTIGNSYTANLAFHRSAIHLLTAVPAMPEGGDAADDVMTITDPQTGLSFQVAMYRQRRRVAYEVGINWGVKAVKSEHMAVLLG